MDASTGTAVPVGPTTVNWTAERHAGSARTAATISGPMPRGSPNVTANRTGAIAAASQARGTTLAPRAAMMVLDAHRHVQVPPHLVDHAAHPALLGQLLANLIPEVGEGVRAAIVGLYDLRDDVFLGGAGRVVDGKGRHERARPLPFERSLVRFRKLFTLERLQTAGLLLRVTIVIPDHKRVEAHPGLPLRRRTVGAQLRRGDVGRVDARTNQNVSRFHFARLDAIHAYDVISERGLDHGTRLPRREREHPALERWDHRAATVPAEITTELLGRRVHRFALGDLLEVTALSNLDQEGLRFG